MTVAIMGILAGLSVTAVGQVRRTMDNMGCLSNLRQIGIAMHAYAADNDNSLPGPCYGPYTVVTGEGGPQRSFSNYLFPYLSSKPIPPYGQYERCLTVLCPAFKKYIPPDQWFTPTYYSYNIIYSIPGVTSSTGGVLSPWGRVGMSGVNDKPLKLSALGAMAKLSETWAVMDLDSSNASASYAPKDAVHGNHRNYLFFDGHVESK